MAKKLSDFDNSVAFHKELAELHKEECKIVETKLLASQDEITRLKENIEVMKRMPEWNIVTNSDLKSQLLASQAREAQLRGALEWIKNSPDSFRTIVIKASNALSQTKEPSLLKAVQAANKLADACDNEPNCRYAEIRDAVEDFRKISKDILG